MAFSSNETSREGAGGESVPVVYAHVLPRPSEMTDAELVDAALKAHEATVSAADSAVEAAVRAGDLLREARRRCEARGVGWSDWLLRNWPKSKRTAERYMALSHASQVEQECATRASRTESTLTRLPLAHPSVRAALEAIDYSAGGTRSEEAEAEYDRIASVDADEPQEKDEPAPAAPPQRFPPRGDPNPAQTVASAAAKARHQDEVGRTKEQLAAERAAINEAEKRPEGPPPQRPKPKVEPYSAKAECDWLAEEALSIGRRIGVFAARLKAFRHYPLGDSYRREGLALVDTRDDDFARIGVQAFAPLVNPWATVDRLTPPLVEHGEGDEALMADWRADQDAAPKKGRRT